MDVEAPNFRAGTLAGVIVGAAPAIVITGASLRMKHRKNEVKRLKGERDELVARPSPTARATTNRVDSAGAGSISVV